ncbi:MAG: tetratricopeptide repeat protein [Burkholderiales bacterium]|nr:tetratricopeptide repeat protein [Burkholderiales bacterium]
MTPLEQGAALLGGGRFHEALQQFGMALRAQPASLGARIGLAQASHGAGDPLTAMAWLSDAHRIAPQEALPAQLLADLLLERRHYDQALPVYRHLYTALNARDRGTLLHLAFCLEQAGELDEAVRGYREAIETHTDFMEAHVDLAGVLWRVGDYEGSLRHARQAVALAPEHPYAVRILGTALLHLNRLEEADRELRRALQLKPGFELAELDLAFVLLLGGRLEEGWRRYARRWNDAQRLQRPVFYNPATEWKGPREQPPAGKAIAVYGEQGLGDIIQFSRYVQLLRNDGARVVCVVQEELVPLIEGSMEGVQCLAPGRTFSADWHVALLDLPMLYGTTLENIPAQVPYLHAPPTQAAQWKERLKPWDGKLKVGLCWAGFLGQVNNRNRSFYLSELQPLLAMEGVQCFSLQKGDAGEFSDSTPGEGQLVDFTGEWQDFNDSAAMLQNLDLVISVDTALPHLAGALARPVWTLLGPNPDWRWLLERDDSPWYPTMRLFRREVGEERAVVVERVVEALRARLAGPA